MIEIETIEAFETFLHAKKPCRHVGIQGLDLRSYSEALQTISLEEIVFLGCQLAPRIVERATKQGALIFPQLPALPYKPYRGSLYKPEELYRGFSAETSESYKETPDAIIYRHWKKMGSARPKTIVESLAQRLHDHAMTDAVEELLESGENEKKVVAIMGGHSMLRGNPNYLAIAEIARTLCRKGFLLVSGGGPGAMEATHLGAWFAGQEDSKLQIAVNILAKAPSYRDTEWLSRAFEVRSTYPLSQESLIKFPSLGIPTWYYGHEPPNPFATHIAKYFANSIREAGLVTVAKHGIIFAPGSAGTIQEIFQDACQNHYNTVGIVSPMVFWGEGYWKWNKPVFPLLAQLAAGKEYARYLTITDEKQKVIESIVNFDRRNAVQ